MDKFWIFALTFLCIASMVCASPPRLFFGDCSYKFCHQKCNQIDEEIIECSCVKGFILEAGGRKCVQANNYEEVITTSGEFESGDGDTKTTDNNCDNEDGCGEGDIDGSTTEPSSTVISPTPSSAITAAATTSKMQEKPTSATSMPITSIDLESILPSTSIVVSTVTLSDSFSSPPLYVPSTTESAATTVSESVDTGIPTEESYSSTSTDILATDAITSTTADDFEGKGEGFQSSTITSIPSSTTEKSTNFGKSSSTTVITHIIDSTESPKFPPISPDSSTAIQTVSPLPEQTATTTTITTTTTAQSETVPLFTKTTSGIRSTTLEPMASENTYITTSLEHQSTTAMKLQATTGVSNSDSSSEPTSRPIVIVEEGDLSTMAPKSTISDALTKEPSIPIVITENVDNTASTFATLPDMTESEKTFTSSSKPSIHKSSTIKTLLTRKPMASTEILTQSSTANVRSGTTRSKIEIITRTNRPPIPTEDSNVVDNEIGIVAPTMDPRNRVQDDPVIADVSSSRGTRIDTSFICVLVVTCLTTTAVRWVM